MTGGIFLFVYIYIQGYQFLGESRGLELLISNVTLKHWRQGFGLTEVDNA